MIGVAAATIFFFGLIYVVTNWWNQGEQWMCQNDAMTWPHNASMDDNSTMTTPQLTWMKFENGDRPQTNGTYVDGNQEYLICRAKVRGQLAPGKFSLVNDTCYVPFGGEEYTVKMDYEILTSAPFSYYWLASSKGNKVENAVPGGHLAFNEEVLYVGRCVHNGTMMPGKIVLSDGALFIADEGLEYQYENYDILVANTTMSDDREPPCTLVRV